MLVLFWCLFLCGLVLQFSSVARSLHAFSYSGLLLSNMSLLLEIIDRWDSVDLRICFVTVDDCTYQGVFPGFTYLVFLLSQVKCDIQEVSDGFMGCGSYFQSKLFELITVFALCALLLMQVYLLL